jgi:VanZ family protein
LITWLWRWAPVAAQMAAIFLASNQQDVPDLPAGLSGYTGHFLGYGLLGILAIRGFAGAAWRGVDARAAVWAVLLCAVYAMTDEWHQSLVPNRSVDVLDWTADVAGAIAGVAVVLLMAQARRRAAGPRTRDV